MKEGDVDISLEGGRPAAKGKREEDKRDEGTTCYALERSFGTFMRTFTLPSNVESCLGLALAA